MNNKGRFIGSGNFWVISIIFLIIISILGPFSFFSTVTLTPIPIGSVGCGLDFAAGSTVAPEVSDFMGYSAWCATDSAMDPHPCYYTLKKDGSQIAAYSGATCESYFNLPIITLDPTKVKVYEDTFIEFVYSSAVQTKSRWQIKVKDTAFSSSIKTDYYIDNPNVVQKIIYKIDSKAITPVTAKIDAEIATKGGVTGLVTDKVTLASKQPVLLNPGINDIEFIIPPIIQVGTYTFSAQAFADATTASAILNGEPSNYLTGPIAINNLISKDFLVNPKPVYYRVNLTASCPIGYILQAGSESSTSKLCTRDDLTGLSCVQLGCPVTVDFTYQCSTAGVCSETITRAAACTSNADCGIGLLCETTTGVCYNEVLQTQIVQCTNTSSSLITCQGVASSCVNGQWQYSGQCQPIIENCNQRGCSGGYSCDPVSGTCQGRDIIERPIIVKTTEVLERGLIGNIQEKFTPTVSIFLILVFFITIIILATRGRKS